MYSLPCRVCKVIPQTDEERLAVRCVQVFASGFMKKWFHEELKKEKRIRLDVEGL